MRVSGSSPSRVLDGAGARPGDAPGWQQIGVPYLLAPGVALAYLAAHLPFLAPSLEDIDSINFALGLHHFDPALHQPHPPGYPVYIALGRLTLPLVHAAGAVGSHADALALAVWSAVAGAVSIVAAWWLFAALAGEARSRSAACAVALLSVAPLFWISGLRPMSDMVGLAFVLVAQACLVRGMAGHRTALTAGALAAGVAAGVRVQTVWLTGLLLIVAIVAQRRLGVRWLISRPIAALAAGVAVWAVPLVAASGGWTAYMRALGTQAFEDFAYVDMLWVNPTPRRLAYALYDSLVLPWSSPSLAAVIAIAAIVGGLVLLARNRRTLAVLLVAFLPYAVLHLLFQETVTVRYALPLVPLVAYLGGVGVSLAGRYAAVAVTPLVVFAAVVAIPVGVAYGREAHPAFRAIDEMTRSAVTERPARVFSHFSMRRPLQTIDAAALPVAEPSGNRDEWRGPVDYWRQGGRAPVWFLADPKRTNLELIDPAARRSVRRYRWTVAADGTLGGVRPTAADWYRLPPPGWFVTDGWSLTPELGGVVSVTRSGPDHRPIEAYVRPRREPSYLMIGGRYLGDPRDGAAHLELAINGQRLDAWTLDPASGLNFLRIVDLPHGIPGSNGVYTRMTVAARAAAAGRPAPAVAIRQFDVQPATGMIHAFGDGWYEDEYDNATGLRWRWTSRRAELRIVPPQAVRVTVRAESPMKYLRAVPVVRMTAGGRTIAELHPADDFTWQVDVPGADILRSNGIVALEIDRVFHQAPIAGAVDTRQLGLRVLELTVNTVLP